MTYSDQKSEIFPRRLCSEVQLFDLCDLDSCSRKTGRFCSDSELLSRFEMIAEDELRTPDRFLFEENDDTETDEGDGNDEEDNEFAMDNFDGGEDDGRDDE